MNIVILERASVGTDISVNCYKDFGDVTVYANTDNEADVIERIKDADIVINNKAPMNARTLANATNVRLIAEFATGFDNVDIPYCCLLYTSFKYFIFILYSSNASLIFSLKDFFFLLPSSPSPLSSFSPFMAASKRRSASFCSAFIFSGT